MTYDQRISGSKGSKLLTGTGAHGSLGAYCLIAQEDTTFSAFAVGGVGSLAVYGLDSSAVLKAGSLITVPEQSSITSITLASGSVVIYNG